MDNSDNQDSCLFPIIEQSFPIIEQSSDFSDEYDDEDIQEFHKTICEWSGGI